MKFLISKFSFVLLRLAKAGIYINEISSSEQYILCVRLVLESENVLEMYLNCSGIDFKI